jgi:GTP-binding protein
VHEFHSLGFADVFPVSAEHRLGMDDLLDHVTAAFPHKGDAELQSKKKPAVRVAIIGRPNVGKSTLLNALTGEDRAIVSPVAGTTRDAVDERVEKDGSEFVFVDTAGIRRKGKTHLMAEKLSVVMARKHIRSSHVALLIVDASEGVVASDATIAGYAHEEGRALILCVNKWDTRQDKERKEFTQQVRDQFKFLEYAQVAFVSALTGRGVSRLFGMIQKAYDSASYRVTTGELNRFVEMLHFDTDVKVKYITQASIRPPTFVVFADRNLHFSTERFLMNQLRKRFGFEGTPIVIKIRRR